MKLLAEIVVSLSVVGAWCYVALTLPAPAGSASAAVAPEGAGSSPQFSQGQAERLIARR
ncbi:hypothetical protein SNE35_22655 [Paucibacter sp. R3-3]|uniref:Uncharacterized protein n=1 Tax=Roseateles agri TaxID=3098619 RepID=A0ABU5DLZ2_9BURK|nr:hypothetical protein [Paucibacter sp. R3-3]MDY0747322.1 hypothetical protein [Paucibacter sp. R3-3]